MTVQLRDLLPAGAVIPHLEAGSKKQTIKKLSGFAAALCPLSEKEIFSALMEREEVGCTGMGNGVCIPHGRFTGLKEILIVFARLDAPINFGAADGKDVDLIFLLLTPLTADTEHLKALAMISKILRDKKLCAQLRAASSAEDIYALITADSSAAV